MAGVSRSALVPFRAEQMFELVDAVEQYPVFLPWCSSSAVSHRDHLVTCATIHISYRGIRQSFTTENRKQHPQLMTMHLIEGPFKALEGEWRFTPLGSDGCKIDFRLQYEFANAIVEKVIGPVFGFIAGSMVDAFLRRANQIYDGS